MRTSGFRNSCDFNVLSRTFYGPCNWDLTKDHGITANGAFRYRQFHIRLGRGDKLKR